MAEASNSPYYGLIADGTTDISAKEQFSCHLFYTNGNFIQQSRFLGFCNAPDTLAETLFLCVKDVFLRLNLPLEKLKGYCFDGASNMSGRLSGVQARLREVCPGSLFVHCCNHSLDLVLQEVTREVPLISETPQFVQSTTNIIGESNKRRTTFEVCFADDETVRCNILGLCPTRWCVGAFAISRVIRAYGPLLQTLQTLHKDVGGEMKSKISGLQKQAKKCRAVFGLLCSEALFSPCEAVAKVLQAEKATAAGVPTDPTRAHPEAAQSGCCGGDARQGPSICC